ncbi:hypothetical protein GQ44DRAFT_2559 [Phaeosphaeriaceae sp. PMI808]|nr:hypothetical protein GQ44DRAFT_2559 [Phaeosphaeriaceae sp. PMI808]
MGDVFRFGFEDFLLPSGLNWHILFWLWTFMHGEESTDSSEYFSKSSHGKTSATAPVSSSTTAASVIGGSTHSGISQGAIIAIAVLATVVGMLLLFIIWMFLKRRNKRQSGTLSALSVPVTERTERISYIQATSKTSDPHVGELSSQTVPRTGPIYEVDNALCIELDTVTRGISTQ